jgi:hypothetical protein
MQSTSLQGLNELRKMLAYLTKQSVDDVLLTVTIAMLKVSTHNKLYDAYSKIRDDIDDGSVRNVCTTKLRKHQPHPARTPRGDTTGTSPSH